jgi:hypothetical protein
MQHVVMAPERTSDRADPASPHAVFRLLGEQTPCRPPCEKDRTIEGRMPTNRQIIDIAASSEALTSMVRDLLSSKTSGGASVRA